MATDRDQKVKTCLKTLLQSKVFDRKVRLSEILEYVVEETLAARQPSQKAIAPEVFKLEEFSGDENDIVRTNVINLRKALDHYYAHEGKDDEIEIYIPKGRYVAKFRPNFTQKPAQVANDANVSAHTAKPNVDCVVRVTVDPKFLPALLVRLHDFGQSVPGGAKVDFGYGRFGSLLLYLH